MLILVTSASGSNGNGHLYCVAQDEVVAFDFARGTCLGSVVQLQRLNGQALEFFPSN
jgi:hypothetical protein